MKFVSFRHAGKVSFGVVSDQDVVDLGARHPEIKDLRDAIAKDQLRLLGDAAQSARADFALSDIEYLPTIPNPEKIICIGVNYANRNAEYKDGSNLPDYPSVFMRARDSLVGHLEDIVDPPESDQLDYEGEIVLIIGREGRRIAQDQAHEYVAGTTIMNEGSVRDYLRHSKFNVTQGKNFTASGSLGPWLVTPDEVDPFDNMRVITRVNSQERQNDVTDNLMFSFRYLISYLSSFYTLKPGDVIATGTPNGAGARFDPPKYLRPQDRIEVEVAGIGTLANSVVTEQIEC